MMVVDGFGLQAMTTVPPKILVVKQGFLTNVGIFVA